MKLLDFIRKKLAKPETPPIAPDTYPIEKEDHFNLDHSYQQLQHLYERGYEVRCRLGKLVRGGFTVKITGLTGFVPTSLMPWRYAYSDTWYAVDPFLRNTFMTGKIIELSRTEDNKVNIKINAQSHKLQPIQLEEKTMYRCILISKTETCLWVEMGYAFDWACGSVIGCVPIHNSLLSEEFKTLQVGDIYQTFFQGYDHKGRIVLGDRFYDKAWVMKLYDPYIGTLQWVDIEYFAPTGIEYYFGDIQCILSSSTYELKNFNKFFKVASRLKKNNKNILCRIVAINYPKKVFVIAFEEEVLEEYIANHAPAKLQTAVRWDFEETCDTPQMIKVIRREGKISYSFRDLPCRLRLNAHGEREEKFLELFRLFTSVIADASEFEFLCDIERIDSETNLIVATLNDAFMEEWVRTYFEPFDLSRWNSKKLWKLVHEIKYLDTVQPIKVIKKGAEKGLWWNDTGQTHLKL